MAKKVDISKKPNYAAYSLGAPVRGTGASRYRLTAKWNFNKRLNDESNPARCEGWHVHWTFDLYNAKTKKWLKLKARYKNGVANRKEWVLNLNSFECTNGRKYTRASFYPHTDWCLRSVTVSVCPYNKKGNGAWTSATRKFERPRKPSIPTLTMRESDGHALLTLKANNGADYREAAYTDFVLGVKDSRTGKNVLEYKGKFNAGTSGSDTEYSYNSLDIKGRMGLAVGDYLMVECRAWTRGFWGYSECAARTFYVSIPWVPQINGATFSSHSDTGRVRFWIDTNATPPHPVTGVKLQAIRNKPYTEASQIPLTDWDSCEDLAEDDAQCDALSTMVGNLRSDDGLYTWVRLKSWNLFEDMYPNYSSARRIDELFKPEPTAEGDEVAIASVEPGADGRSARLVLAFDDDGDTGTEVSWSDDVNAWQSAEPPKTFEVTWQEEKSVKVGTKTYSHQSVVYIPNLDEGKTYYFRARRFLEADRTPTFGPYNAASADTPCTPVTAPSGVTLVVPGFVPRGRDLMISWVHEGDSEQARWEVITGATRAETDERGREHLYIRGDSDASYPVVSVAGGDDARGGCVIKWDLLAEKLGGEASIPLAVRVSTGGEFVTSEAHSVLVVDRPTVSVSAADLSTRPQSLSLTCDTDARVAVTCISQGVGGEGPAGMSYQEDGDAVWSDELEPQWEVDEEGVHSITVEVPDTVELWDGGRYTVRVTATDPATGLESEEATCEFEVDYSRKSPGPPDGVTVTPYDTTDPETGWRTLGCAISLPEDATLLAGDAYDVYRVTLDGADLVAEGVVPGATVDDTFAPFGGDGVPLSYRVAVRTPDGCVNDWQDYTYGLEGYELRIDWDGGYVELPYDLVVNGQWSKPFGRTRFFGGSQEGFWEDGGVEYDGGLSTDVIKLVDRDRIEATFRLAEHCGPCLVRTPDGRCYDANVDVRSYRWGFDSAAVPVSLDVKRIDLTEEHMASLPDPLEGDATDGTGEGE